ncbi:formate--tetrahydrofolate ligase [Arthrobacter sp. MYb229]|uniref:formate--tetrahydrofolate ligase n=1 Tax=unclassified Arthrobacter TaxID=235627 RepID=UPI000CFB8A9E|nr:MULTISPECIES: formate--tetrahydrofolate ligase [unclassified Arthrobacter]PRA04228.1 formate--tetrahydrofolate ligase [Arthrobacter sp. MYb229]PRB51860.1 formate--tetrahydrofolate ligase [Arthrobacter sp. MYb216]
MTATPETDMSNLGIASRAALRPISEIAESAGIPEAAVESYGRYKAKVDPSLLTARGVRPGKVVLVSGISPTPAGEGKSTMVVGLGDALAATGAKTMIALREPSMGPNFGMKGGATGGGYSQVLPMDEINMHFTGDFHAITSANNLLMALLDNHLHQGNALGIDPRRITFKRVLDMNDRALRHVVIGLGGATEGIPRETGFEITVASEVMAVFCLATGLEDLRARLGRMTIGYTYDKAPVTVDDLGAAGAMAMLLKDAIKPNLVQSMGGTPAFIHGGPFANIAHGCNSAIATNTARALADVVVTEAGFGTDLGAEKFMDIKARYAGCDPDTVVIVATIRALKMHGGVPKGELGKEDVAAVRAGLSNLARHASNIRKFGIQPVIGINRFTADTEAELAVVTGWAEAQGVECAIADVWGHGGAGAGDLASAVLRAIEAPNNFAPLYELELPIEEKILTVVREIYGGADVEYSASARRMLEQIHANGWDDLPVCMAKTQYSFSDDPKLLGAPEGFTLQVHELIPKTGAGFIVAITGAIMTMPGLPKVPSAMHMDVDGKGNAVGLS